ncbi:MAG: lipoyl synthase [Pseudomonadota bacterium]
MEPTSPQPEIKKRASLQSGIKLRGAEKMARIPVRFVEEGGILRKPDWIRVRIPASGKAKQVRAILRENRLHSVCEEAACPNLPECFGKGTATFMILGDICTRRCTFCDVAHGRPLPPDPEEPVHLAQTIAQLKLKYVVITSVDRDDLLDGGAKHFSDCITAIRVSSPEIKIEVLVPDFRGRLEKAIDAMSLSIADVFNHNIETVPRLYKTVRPGSDYAISLHLLQNFKQRFPHIPTKSGIMLGLGETIDEVKQVLQDMRNHQIDMVTMGQYLQPSLSHHPVLAYIHPDTFDMLGDYARELGFTHVASGPMVRSSYHADLQAEGVDVGRMIEQHSIAK